MKSKYSFMPVKSDVSNRPERRLLIGAAAALALALASGCASSKKSDRVELSDLLGKKVALVEIQGEPTARKVVEVALVNQLVKHGSFELIGKREVERAKARHDVRPDDWAAVAKAAGADLALVARVQEFKADEHEGYSTETVYDEQLAEERGEDAATTERVYKVRAIDGSVKVELEFQEYLKPSDEEEQSSPDVSRYIARRGIAEATDRVVAEGKSSAAYLPPKLRFLEDLANRAFVKFFKDYE